MRRIRPATVAHSGPTVSSRWVWVRSRSRSFWLWLAAAAGVAAGTTACGQEANVQRPWMFSEAKLPEGFPAAGPVDEVIVKTYPAHRLARVRTEGDDNGMFMKLFRHIERNEIKMTAPVEMSWQQAADKEPVAMAFLYATPSIGTPGADPEDPRVVVEDIPEIKVVSIGLRGGYDQATFNRGAKRLEAWLTEHPEWKAAGDLRTLAYNSPFVPGFAKYSEVQLPLEPAAPQEQE
jgi:effector-binding domain-containing protein